MQARINTTLKSNVANAAARTLKNLPKGGNAKDRVSTTESAVDQFLKDHGSSEEVAGLRLANHLAKTRRVKVRTGVLEDLMRAGLELTANGLGGSGAPLAAAALKFAELGRDDNETRQLFKAGYDKLSKEDQAAKAHPFSKAVRSTKSAGARRAMLNILASDDQGPLHDQAASLIAGASGNRTTASLGRQLIDELARANPDNEAYLLADKNLGNNIFTKLKDDDASKVVRSFLTPGEPTLEEGVGRIGHAVRRMNDWKTSAKRAAKFAQSRVNDANQQRGTLLLKTVSKFDEFESAPGKDGARMTGVLLGKFPTNDDNGRPMMAALADWFDQAAEPGKKPFREALEVAENAMDTDQWKSALKFIKSEVGQRHLDREHLARTFLNLKEMPRDGDPLIVAAMTSKINGSTLMRESRHEAPKPPHDLESLKAYFQTDGNLRHGRYTKSALMTMRADAESPEVRDYAKSLLAKLYKGV